jgi:hypothetical protein
MFAITGANVLHQGYNSGHNLAEAVNFVAPSWLSTTYRNLRRCTCSATAPITNMHRLFTRYTKALIDTLKKKSLTRPINQNWNTKILRNCTRISKELEAAFCTTNMALDSYREFDEENQWYNTVLIKKDDDPCADRCKVDKRWAEKLIERRTGDIIRPPDNSPHPKTILYTQTQAIQTLSRYVGNQKRLANAKSKPYIPKKANNDNETNAWPDRAQLLEWVDTQSVNLWDFWGNLQRRQWMLCIILPACVEVEIETYTTLITTKLWHTFAKENIELRPLQIKSYGVIEEKLGYQTDLCINKFDFISNHFLSCKEQ